MSVQMTVHARIYSEGVATKRHLPLVRSFPLLARPFANFAGAFICTYLGIRTLSVSDDSAIEIPVRLKALEGKAA